MEDLTTEYQNDATIQAASDDVSLTTTDTLIEIADLTTELREIRTRHHRLATDLDERRSALNASFTVLQREKKRTTARTSPKARTSGGPNAAQTEAAVRQHEAIHARRLSEFESARCVAERERSRLSDQSRSLAQRRDALVAHLPQAAATRYQKLVSRGVELPIAAIDAGACGGCGAILRPMRSKNVCVCSSCGRLLITAPRHVKGHA